MSACCSCLCFVFYATATTCIYTYLPPPSLHDARPIYSARTLICIFTLAILATLHHACHCPFHFPACARFPGADIPSATQPAARNVSPLSQGMRWQCQGA